MPKGTKVEKLYQELLKKGYSKSAAAKIAQSQTGQSLQTGKKPKKKGKK
jgi:hypothetical protein